MVAAERHSSQLGKSSNNRCKVLRLGSALQKYKGKTAITQPYIDGLATVVLNKLGWHTHWQLADQHGSLLPHLQALHPQLAQRVRHVRCIAALEHALRFDKGQRNAEVYSADLLGVAAAQDDTLSWVLSGAQQLPKQAKL